MKKIYFISIIVIALAVQIDAQTWTTVTTPSTSGVSDMLVANNKLYIATTSGLFSSIDGITWDSTSTGITYASNFGGIYNYNDVLYSTRLSELYKSVDYGANWTEIIGVKEPYTSPTFTAVYVKGDTMIVGLNKSLGFRKSYDGGTTWTRTAVSEVIDKDIIAMNGALFVKTQKGIFKSTDMATSFTQLTGGLPTYGGSVGAITESNGVLICTIYLHGTYISSDNGVTWTETSTTMASGRGFHVAGGSVYLGGAGGEVYSSSDDGTTWANITGTGIGAYQVTNFAVFNGDLYAGTGYELYKTPISTSVYENDQEENSFSIYPNPVSDKLTISSVKEFNNCIVKLYSITGELLIEQNAEGKKQSIDMGDYSNGIYILEVNQNNSVLRQKIVNN